MAMTVEALKDKLKIRNTRVFTGTGTITMLNEGVLVVNKAVGAATAVTLTPSPEEGDVIFIKDGKGDALTNNITCTPAAGNIDGAANKVIASNYGALALFYNGTQWNVLDERTLAAATIALLTTGVAAGYKIARGVTALDGSNPTPVATGLSTVVSATVTLEGSSAPGVGTSVLTQAETNWATGALAVYAWKPTSNADPTLIASTGTESFSWIAIGT